MMLRYLADVIRFLFVSYDHVIIQRFVDITAAQRLIKLKIHYTRFPVTSP